VAVMPVAVACVIDAMVCICVGSFVHGVWKFRMGAKVFMSSSVERAPKFHVFKFCSWDSTSAFESGTKFLT
jgi:hypothetical protein